MILYNSKQYQTFPCVWSLEGWPIFSIIQVPRETGAPLLWDRALMMVKSLLWGDAGLWLIPKPGGDANIVAGELDRLCL